MDSEVKDKDKGVVLHDQGEAFKFVLTVSQFFSFKFQDKLVYKETFEPYNIIVKP